MNSARLLAGLVATAAFGALLTGPSYAAATPVQAAAWECGQVPTDAIGDQRDEVKGSSAPARIGYYEKCDPISRVSGGVMLACFVENDYGNTWSYAPGYGWIYDKNLKYNGATTTCSFL
ncbi:hypothetical protein [Streptomyces sp. WAC05858]|uniref:hypothetical protein n=1 Tax=Streptomyces TaxID=1883 RepID=UPI000F79B209|nr:hypothetical protein [Streptomyces sp. WAC05858]RSS46280.1 hypothetical protein EF902_12375 [Streptomyces sp. WAC05858]